MPAMFVSAQTDGEIILYPVEDAYTSSVKPDGVFAFDDNILVGTDNDALYNGYVRFNLEDKVSENDKILLYIEDDAENKNRIDIYSCANNDFISADLTYNNAASVAKTGTKMVTCWLGGGETVMLDVSDYVFNNLTDRRNISFVFSSQETLFDIDSFNGNNGNIKLIVQKNKRNEKVAVTEESLGLTKPSDDTATEENSPKSIYGDFTPPVFDTSGDEITIWDNNTSKRVKTTEVVLPEVPEISDDINLEDYTATYYKPWLANYHVTTPGDVLAERKGGEVGQRIVSGAVSPHDPNIVLIGTDVLKIYRSDDFGTNWTISSDGFDKAGVPDIEFDPYDEGVVYALGSAEANKTFDNQGIYKSTDNGRTWRFVYNFKTWHKYNLKSFAFTPPDEDGSRIIFAASFAGDGIHASYDEGETWQRLGMTGRAIWTMDFADGELIICSPEGGIEVSTDYGKTFKQRMNGFDDPGAYYIDIDPGNSSRWVVTSYDKLYITEDKGYNWKVLGDVEYFTGATGGQMCSVEFSAPWEDGHSRLFAQFSPANFRTRYSDDYGKTFYPMEQYTEGSSNEDSYGQNKPILLDPTNPNRAIFVIEQVYRSYDGGKSIYPASSGFSGHRNQQMAFNPDDYNDMYFGVTDFGFITSLPSGREGEVLPLGTLWPCEDRFWIRYESSRSVNGIAVDPKNRDRVFIMIGTWNKQTLKVSVDGGLNFTEVGLGSLPSGQIWFNHSNPDVIYASNQVSYDDGKTWNNVGHTILAMSPIDGNVIYTHESDSGLLKSSDCGRTWTQIAPKVGAVQRIVADAEIPDRLYVGTYNRGLAIVQDGVITFKNSADGLRNGTGNTSCYYDVVQDPNNPDHLITAGHMSAYYGTGSGIHESFDRGETWEFVCEVPGSCDVWALHIRPDGSMIYLCTSNGTFVYFPDKFYDQSEHRYLDVKSTEDSYAMAEIEYLYDNGVTNQYTDGYFKPKETAKRWEFVKACAAALDLTTHRDTEIFSDIGLFNRHFYYTGGAYEAGLLTLNAEKTFNPYDDITYEQAATIIARMLRYKNFIKTNEYEEIEKNISYDNAYKICTENNIITDLVGYKENTAATREDLAYMLCNAVKLIK